MFDYEFVHIIFCYLAKYNWEDPLLLESQLTDEEKAIR